MTKKFSGALKQRIAPPKPFVVNFAEISSAFAAKWLGIPWPPQKRWENWQLETQRIKREQREKLDLLAEHYGIPQTANRDTRLALRLAQEFVPGFQFMKKRGAPPKWPDNVRGALVVEINALCKPGVKGKGPTNAAKLLSTREPWCRMLKELNEPAEALLNVYKNTKRNDGDLVSRIKKNERTLRGIPGWDRVI